MPIKEYRCKKCGQERELIVKTTTEKVICEKCGVEMEKLLSTFSFRMNGYNANNGYGRK